MAAVVGTKQGTALNGEYLNLLAMNKSPARAKHKEPPPQDRIRGVTPMFSEQVEVADGGRFIIPHSQGESERKKQEHKLSEAWKFTNSNSPPYDVILISSSDDEAKERRRKGNKPRKETKRKLKGEHGEVTEGLDVSVTLLNNGSTTHKTERGTWNRKRKSEEHIGSELVRLTANKKKTKQEDNHEKHGDKVNGAAARSSSPLRTARRPPFHTDALTQSPTTEATSQDMFIHMPIPPKPAPVGDLRVEVPMTEPPLCQEQTDLVELVMTGRNVFYTGSAGCGKSTVLKAIVRNLRTKGKKVHIVAPTGRAALAVNGTTTWMYAGWTPARFMRPVKELEEAARFGKFVYKRLNSTDVLVIDEISMVENHHFERLNSVMQSARNNQNAFGGVQLVVTGDFCQLPPV